MKRILLLWVCLIGLSPLYADDGLIVLRVQDIVREKGGKIFVALHSNEESFVTKKRHYRDRIIDVKSGEDSCVFRGVPSGHYAISIFHDANGNGRLNTNFWGVPREGYGFSKNVYGPFWTKPSFLDASFEVKKGERVVQKIKLKY